MMAGGKALRTTEVVQSQRSRLNASQTSCADMIAHRMGLDPATPRAQFRQRVLSPLNAHLAAQGYLVEPLLCERRAKDINFYRAAKGALSKYERAIKADEVAGRRWARAMKNSSSAVPDIEDLTTAVDQFLEEQDYGEDERMFPLRFAKAVETAKASRQRLVEKAKALLDQVGHGASQDQIAERAGGAAEEAEEKDGMQEAATEVEQALASGVIPLVDVKGVSERSGTALLLAALVVLRAQQDGGTPQLLAVHGDDGHHIVRVLPEWDMAALVDHVQNLGPGEMAGDLSADVLSAMAQKVLAAHADELSRSPASTAGTAAAAASDFELADEPTKPANTVNQTVRTGPLDLLVLCVDFVAGTKMEQPRLEALAERLPTLCPSQPARGLLVHQNRLYVLDEGDERDVVELQPRRALAFHRRQDAVVDVAFVMDLTASMGSWMSAAQDHLTDIVRQLQTETQVAAIRVAFVGYRDWRDHDRVVTKDFCSMSEVEQVVQFIHSQHPSGGNDAPEDVISGMEAATRLDWQGHIRLVVHVADACAHGYTDRGNADDNFPSGLCPDQRHTLPEVLKGLRDTQSVDLLFCRLTSSTRRMERMFQEVYGAEGFGLVPMTTGASRFRDVILGALSRSLLSLVADVEIAGVQTFQGSTLSAAVATSNASLRESFQAVARALRGGGDEDGEEAGEEGDQGDEAEEIQEGEQEKEAAAGAEEVEEGKHSEPVEADMEDGRVDELSLEEPGTEEATTEEAAAGEVRWGKKKKAAPKPRSDKTRLMVDLESEDLAPVRLALGLPLPGGKGLSVDAAKVLLRAGVTAVDLEANGYPPMVIASMKEAAAEVIRRL